MSNHLMYDLADALTGDLVLHPEGKVTGPKMVRRLRMNKQHHLDYAVEVLGGTCDNMKGTVLLKVSTNLHILLLGFRPASSKTALYFMAIDSSVEPVDDLHEKAKVMETKEELDQLIASNAVTGVWTTIWQDKSNAWEKVK